VSEIHSGGPVQRRVSDTQEARKNATMRYVVLWALGVPITGLIVLHLLGLI
jgi:hypothetical protein